MAPRKKISLSDDEDTILIRRDTDHPNIKKNSSDPFDLWALASHHLIYDQCKALLKKAYEGSDLPSGCRPINRVYKSFKQNGSSFRKCELLARILCLRTTRIMCFEQLKQMKNSSIPRDAKLKDYYLQFYVGGPTFPADAPDSDDLKIKAGIPIVVDSEDPPIETNFTNEISPKTLNRLRYLISTNEQIDPEREQLISRFLKHLSFFETPDLQRFVEQSMISTT